MSKQLEYSVSERKFPVTFYTRTVLYRKLKLASEVMKYMGLRDGTFGISTIAREVIDAYIDKYLIEKFGEENFEEFCELLQKMT